MILLNNITKEYGSKTVLDDVTLTFYDGERVAIIGNNGVGKSTLLNIITNETKPDLGSVSSNDTIAYLKQSSELDLHEIFDEISKKELANSFEIELKKLGVKQDITLSKERLDKLSPGERTKIALAFCMAKEPSVLVLDEPTNHLDQKGKSLLVDYLNEFFGTIIFVSHDKDFIDQIAQKVVELKDGKIEEYYGNYSSYVEQKENEQLAIKRNYEKHKKEVEDINRQIEVYKRALEKSDKKCHQGASRRTCNTTTQDERAKSLSKFASNRMSKLKQALNKDVEKPEREVKIRYNLKKEDFKTRFLYVAENLGKRFGNNVLYENANFTIENGDKIALLGDNGAGKSTLVNILLGLEDYDGLLRTSPSVKPVLMKQDVYDLDENLTINEMSQQKDKEYRTSFITNLCSMNIDKSRFDTKIKNLSSGEKMRIKLCEIILSDFNFLILDEPTNHLDILNKDYLQKVLMGFEGTLLIISHDKSFLDGLTNKKFIIDDKTIKVE